MKHYYVGTSGYQYKHWRDNFYPNDIKIKDWLPFYSGQFKTVEINNSFYRLPSATVFKHWHDETPPDFVFAIKASRFVTHNKRLREPVEPVERLFNAAEELGPKLGVVLWQFFERWPFNQEHLERLAVFCRTLQQRTLVRQAFEFRRQDWFNDRVYELLKQYHYALVFNHAAKWPQFKVATADWAYWRFHGLGALYGSNYSERELKSWAVKAAALPGDVYAYFNNDVGGYAPRNAQTFRHQLDMMVQG